MATIIDGKAIAAELREQVKLEVAELKSLHNIVPGLAVILVGSEPASEIYVRNKGKACREAGMESFDFHLPATVTQEDLLKQVEALNKDERVHGILVQLPLPRHIDENAVINAVDPVKDVDGFHVTNVGKLATGQDGMVPCTPLGCLILLKSVLGDSISGKNALVIGRSNIVGKPIAQLLLRENCTVTIAHSRSKRLADIARRSDIIVAAAGKPEMVKSEWIKSHCVVIDVGINRITLSDGSQKLVGDVAFAEAAQNAKAITPVPGGVGPMTIACLLINTLKAACIRHGIEPQMMYSARTEF